MSADVQRPSISLRNVSKRYPIFHSKWQKVWSTLGARENDDKNHHVSLDGIDLDIYSGDTMGVLGPNGAGKSTLLKIICGTLTATRGDIVVDGSIAALLELGAGFNPQWTGRQNVQFQSRINGIDRSNLAGIMEDVEDFADVGHFFDQPMKTYSTGMFMRVAFASAIMVDPDILIIDEALAVGDVHFQQKCFRKFRQFQEAGKTILFVTHSPELIAANCTRAIVLEGGKLVYQGTPGNAVNTYLEITYGKKSKGTSVSVVEESEQLGTQHFQTQYKDTQQTVDPVLLKTTSNEIDNASNRLLYNDKEFRYGTGAAKVTDFEIFKDEEVSRNFDSCDEARIAFRVHFLKDVQAPFFGLVLKSVDDLRIYGTTDHMQKHKSAPARAGETRFVEFKCPLMVPGGTLFVDVGVGATDGDEILSLDVRNSITHLAVTTTSECNGIGNFQAKFHEYEAEL